MCIRDRLVKIYAPSLPKPYNLIICYQHDVELVSVEVYVKQKLEMLRSFDGKTTKTIVFRTLVYSYRMILTHYLLIHCT